MIDGSFWSTGASLTSVEGHPAGSSVFRSADGGRTWTATGAPPGILWSSAAATGRTFAVGQVDTNAGGPFDAPELRAVVISTDDGGATWTERHRADDNVGGTYTSVASASGVTWVAGEQPGVLRSTDGGRTWSKMGRTLQPVC